METVNQPLISIRRHKNNSLFLVVNTELLPQPKAMFGSVIKGMATFFEKVDSLTQHRSQIVATAGVGLGLGLSLTLFQQPQLITAVPDTTVLTSGVKINAWEVRLPEQKVAIITNSDERSASLGTQGVVAIEVPNNEPASKDLKKVMLGESVKIVGSNNGIYAYRVVETRTLPTAELETLRQQNQETVLIYTATNPFNTEVFALIARPSAE